MMCTIPTDHSKGGLEEVSGVDRWEQFGDVQWKEADIWGKPIPGAAANNRGDACIALTPRNPHFHAAVSAAKDANPAVSPYVWEPALKLLAHPAFAAEPLAMVIEAQLYLEGFLEHRKAVHCYYKITRAAGLSSLVQDCRKHATNPEVAFDRHIETAGAADGGGGAPPKAKPAYLWDFGTMHC